MKISKKIVAILLSSFFMIALAGCDRDGPVENAGEQIDDTVEDTGDAFEDATDGN